MNSVDEAIAILQALKEGKKLQVRAQGDIIWLEKDVNHLPNFAYLEYRIKPTPLECWVNVYKEGDPALHQTKELAERCATGSAVRIAVHMREVESSG